MLMGAKVDHADVYIGKKAELKKGILKIRHPVEHGIIKEWGDMENLWSYTFGELKVSSSEHPVLLTEPLLNPYSNRERSAEIFFDQFLCPALYICSQALLSLYANAKTTGVILDCGDGVCQCAPAYDGFILDSASQRVDIGGRYFSFLNVINRDVTLYLNRLLRRAGHVFSTSVFDFLPRNSS